MIILSWDDLQTQPLPFKHRYQRLQVRWITLQPAMEQAFELMAEGRKNVMVWQEQSQPAKRSK